MMCCEREAWWLGRILTSIYLMCYLSLNKHVQDTGRSIFGTRLGHSAPQYDCDCLPHCDGQACDGVAHK